MKVKNVTYFWGVGIWHFFLFWAEFFLAVRFVLRFFAVNPTNGFAAWVFNSTNALVAPFRAVFTGTVKGHPHFVDLQTLFVMAAYAAFVAVVLAVTSRSQAWVVPNNKK
jgi:hypothetical protein